MVMEIIIGVIALTFVVLVVFLIMTLQSTRKTLKRTDRVLMEVHKNLEAISEVSVELLQNVNKLTLDIKKKSESLDVFFRPLHHMKKEDKDISDVISDIAESTAGIIRLFNHLKEGIKRYVKS